MNDKAIKRIYQKYAHISDMTGFLREMKEAGVTLTELASEMGWSNKEMLRAVHLGEAVIPSRDNAALSQGDVVTPTLGWADELPSKPSKRVLLEQILAEQRKTNGLLTRMLGDQRAIRLAIEVPLQSLQAIRFVDPAAPPACPASSGLPGLSPLDSGQSSR